MNYYTLPIIPCKHLYIYMRTIAIYLYIYM